MFAQTLQDHNASTDSEDIGNPRANEFVGKRFQHRIMRYSKVFPNILLCLTQAFVQITMNKMPVLTVHIHAGNCAKQHKFVQLQFVPHGWFDNASEKYNSKPLLVACSIFGRHC